MKRLLVFGMSPLPFENMKKNFGPGIRAWQFIQPLLKKNFEVLLIANRIPYIYPEMTPPEVKKVNNNFQYIHMAESAFHDTARIQELHDCFEPDAILAATLFSTSPLHDLNTNAPIWIDLFGHVMAEAQAKAFRYQDDSYLEHFWKYEFQAISIGDKFSTVSNAQAYATIGELGFIGRLNHASTGYDFCHTIPCAMDPELLQHKKIAFRGNPVPKDAFVVLWSGGYNTWTDIDTLIEGFEIAMESNPNIWFVSTGGQIDGHDEKTYPRFLNKVAKSKFKNRFLLKGWIDKSSVADYYFEANIGINIDHFMYEGMFGSKNRILDWLRAGLPSLVGDLCELSRELPNQGLAYNFPLHDPQALGNKILELAMIPEKVKETGIKAQKYAQNFLTFDYTTRVFQNWLEHPEKSPDSLTNTILFSGISSDSTAADQIQNLQQHLHATQKHIRELEQYVHRVEQEFFQLEKAQIIPNQQPVNLNTPRGKPLYLPDDAISVSFIIVSWNGEKYLQNCLQSIFKQNYPCMECIVIDNASTDHSISIIQNNFPEVKLIPNHKNFGFSKALNQGLEICTGDVIILLNQDTICCDGMTAALVDALKNDPSIAIAGCKIYYPGEKILQHAGGILHPNGLTDHYGANEPDEGQYDTDKDCAYVTGAAFAFKRELMRIIGTFDTRFSPAYFEELDFCLRATRSNYRVRYVSSAKIVHFESTSTGKFSSKFYRLYHRNRLKFMLKHFSLSYLIRDFRRMEIDWFKKYAPKEQYLPLMLAYISNTHRICWAITKGMLRRIS